LNRLRHLLAVLCILAAPLSAQQFGQWAMGPGAFGHFHWKAPVANQAALPASGNSAGDARVTLDTGDVYTWSGAAWVNASGDTDTNASTLCAGTTTYLDGEGGCDDISAVYEAAGAFSGVGACGANQAVTTLNDALAPTCSEFSALGQEIALGTETSGGYAASLTEGGAATTATALAANGGNCGAGEAAAGVDASGASEGCFTPAGVTDHGALTGLGDDDHSQYPLLAGRAGGQTLIGGIAASENLTLDSTTHATRGKVIVSDALLYLGASRNLDAGGCGGGFIAADASFYAPTIGASTTWLGMTSCVAGPGAAVTSSGNGILLLMGSASHLKWTSGSYNGTADIGLKRVAAGLLGVTNGSTGYSGLAAAGIYYTPLASPPITCGDANTQGWTYTDTSGALCWCDGTAWVVLAGAGSCA